MFSILTKDREKQMIRVPYALFPDRNIDRIIGLVTAGMGEEVRKMYDLFPADRDEAAYRRGIFGDFKKADLTGIFEVFRSLLDEWADCREKKEKFGKSLQQCIWYIRETHAYVSALDVLRKELPAANPSSEGLKGLIAFLSDITENEEYRQFVDTVRSLYDELMSFRIKIAYTRDKFVISEGNGTGRYEEDLHSRFDCGKAVFRSPYLNNDLNTAEIEYETAKLLMKKHKEFADRAQAFYAGAGEYVNEDILILKNEVMFYIAYLKFITKMKESGYEFTSGETDGNRFSAYGLYDLALATAYNERGGEVVANDASLSDEESFFVITGPNQGGKTTFARSLGQLVYFYKMGLDVPAKKAVIPFFGRILTHFSVEESNATGRGKLVEELERLKPIMEDKETNAFIVINELFTTAAHLDACKMGEKVLKHLIAAGDRGAYVTHINELSTVDPAVVSLAAEIDENRNRTYKIVRKEAGEYVGTDALTVKYGLTYGQIKERLA